MSEHFSALISCSACIHVHCSSPGGDGTQANNITVEGKQYWAKGTGFGTGSFNSKWNMKETVTKQQQEEALVTILFEVSRHHISFISVNTVLIYIHRCWENILKCWVMSTVWTALVQICSMSVLTLVFYQH